jgi:Poly-beta-hydroxybutyrate polymerase (PhaC) N-terminus
MMIGDVRGVAHLEPLGSGCRISKGEQGHDEDWHKSPFHDFLKKSYLINTRYVNNLIDRSSVDERTRRKAFSNMH